MKMDLIILGIFLVTVIVCVVRGFLLTLVSFLRGIASWIIAFIFCDDLANLFLTNTKLGETLAEKINNFLNVKIDSSNFMNMIPSMFRDSVSDSTNSLIEDGSVKIAEILVTVASFFLIAVLLTIILGIIVKAIKNRDKESLAAKTDRTVGAVLGVVLGLIYVYLFLALLIPVLGFIIPNQAETVMGWFDGSIVAKQMYDNNVLLILIKKLI